MTTILCGCVSCKWRKAVSSTTYWRHQRQARTNSLPVAAAATVEDSATSGSDTDDGGINAEGMEYDDDSDELFLNHDEHNNQLLRSMPFMNSVSSIANKRHAALLASTRTKFQLELRATREAFSPFMRFASGYETSLGDENGMEAGYARKERKHYDLCGSRCLSQWLVTLHHELLSASCARRSIDRIMKSIGTTLRPVLRTSFPGVRLPESAYGLQTLVNHEKKCYIGYIRIDACPNYCILYLNEFAEKETCPICHRDRFDDRTKKPTLQIYYQPLAQTLRKWFDIPHVRKALKIKIDYKRLQNNAYRDVQDGSLFQSFVHRNSNSPLSQALILSADGGAIAKFSSFGMWPVTLQFANLPPHLRHMDAYTHPWMLIPGISI